MDELELRSLVARVKHGTLSRRGFVWLLAGAGLCVPIAGQILLHAGVAQSATGQHAQFSAWTSYVFLLQDWYKAT